MFPPYSVPEHFLRKCYRLFRPGESRLELMDTVYLKVASPAGSCSATLLGVATLLNSGHKPNEVVPVTHQ